MVRNYDLATGREKKSPVSNLTYEVSFFSFTLKKGKFNDTKD